MTRKKPAKKAAQKKSSNLFTAEERAAMRELAQERKAAGRGKEADEKAVLDKIATLSTSDRKMAERVHSIVRASAPELSAKLWYGMPAYAKDDKVVCFFQGAQKFKARYSTLGFTDKAKLDEGEMWPTTFALMKLGSAEEAKIAALVKKAMR